METFSQSKLDALLIEGPFPWFVAMCRTVPANGKCSIPPKIPRQSNGESGNRGNYLPDFPLGAVGGILHRGQSLTTPSVQLWTETVQWNPTRQETSF